MVPATQEAEAGELLEPRRRRLQVMPLHSSLADKSEIVSEKKRKSYFNQQCIIYTVIIFKLKIKFKNVLESIR